ncbi:hypothetical protein HXX01_03660 [Candidatus Nomurabacteria bacterium]|nr:hypothetical protein [Candidatus Nomurabacteria bacterium]
MKLKKHKLKPNIMKNSRLSRFSKRTVKLSLIGVFFALTILLLSCVGGVVDTPVPTLPAISIAEVTEVTQTSVSLKSNVSSDGNDLVTEKGFCLGLASGPSISANDFKITAGVGVGSFTGSVSGLKSGATYYVRSYAKNSIGIVYGTDVTFTTNAIMYDVTIFSGTNGTVTAPKQVADGGSLTLTAVPNPGFMTDSVTVNGLRFNLNGTNTYTVMNNLKAPIISVTFKIDVMWTLLEAPWTEILYQQRNSLSGPWMDYHVPDFKVEKHVFHQDGTETPYLDGNQQADRKYIVRNDSLFLGVYPNGLYGNKYKIIQITRDILVVKQSFSDSSGNSEVQKTFKH